MKDKNKENIIKAKIFDEKFDEIFEYMDRQYKSSNSIIRMGAKDIFNFLTKNKIVKTKFKDADCYNSGSKEYQLNDENLTTKKRFEVTFSTYVFDSANEIKNKVVFHDNGIIKLIEKSDNALYSTPTECYELNHEETIALKGAVIDFYEKLKAHKVKVPNIFSKHHKYIKENFLGK